MIARVMVLLALGSTPAMSQIVMVSLGPSSLSASVDEREGSDGLRWTPNVTLRVPNRYVWLDFTFETYNSGPGDLSINSLTFSPQLRIYPLHWILYGGPSVTMADVELGDGDGRGYMGVGLNFGVLYQPTRCGGVDLQFLLRPESEMGIGRSEVELSTWSVALSYSVYL